MNVISKAEDAQDKATSWVVLYEQIQRNRVTGQPSLQTIEREGITFYLNWSTDERICIEFETRSAKITQTCSEIMQ